jgi:polysaccharide export outer membrane protein
MAAVRVVHAFRLPMIAAMTAFGLSGCMHTSGPVATAQPQSDLDYMAYGQPYNSSQAYNSAPAPRGIFTSSNPGNGGGAIAALSSGFAAPRRATYSSAAYHSPSYPPASNPSAAYAAAPGYAAAPTPVAYDASYKLDAGDKLRVVVYGQEGLTNTYAIDAAGSITMPLIGSVSARGRTPAGLAAEISAKLRNGYIRDPSVAVEIDSYRPFFILGEVQAPGQYPYVPNMSVESAVAIAGGFSPRAKRDSVTLTHSNGASSMRVVVPLGTAVSPGDTVLVNERWF